MTFKLPDWAKDDFSIDNTFQKLDNKPGFTISHHGSGLGSFYTQKEVDAFFNGWNRAWHESKRQAFIDILDATKTRLGGFF